MFISAFSLRCLCNAFKYSHLVSEFAIEKFSGYPILLCLLLSSLDLDYYSFNKKSFFFFFALLYHHKRIFLRTVIFKCLSVGRSIFGFCSRLIFDGSWLVTRCSEILCCYFGVKDSEVRFSCLDFELITCWNRITFFIQRSRHFTRPWKKFGDF